MENSVLILLSGDPERAVGELKRFIDLITPLFTFSELNHNNYRRDLWRVIYTFIRNPKLTHLHADSLSAIRILSRDKTDLNELVCDDLMDCIIEHAALKSDQDFDDTRTHLVAMEAQKCLCNLLFNSPVAAAITCKNGTIEGVARRLRTFRDPKVPPDIKFFDIKILFLITALCPEVRKKLKDELHGLTYLIESLDLVIKESTDIDHNADKQEACDANKKILNDQEVDICCEILKTLFNLSLREQNAPVDEEDYYHYKRLVIICRDYLVVKLQNAKKRSELTNHIVNLLTNMPNSCFGGLVIPLQDGQIVPKEVQYEEQDMTAMYEILEFIKLKMNCNSQSDNLSPVLTTLLKSAVGVRPIRKYLRVQILPPLRDVHNRPEQGDSLRNGLCRLLTSPNTQIRDLSAELLFVLCKENVNRMIKYTGYGNAAGLFASRGLLGGGRNGDVSNYSSESEDSDTEEYKQFKHGINPVVGCYEPPHPNPTAHMTEEQKEYEAMKLVELMDKLTQTGVVKPCKIGEDGRPVPVEHVLQLQEGLRDQQVHMDDDSD